ncbi:D-isomer specific 2-hydroxyacid dehydrogenase family protein [Streptomyces sp. CC224B]|uniref:D-isomer specific 2-hydroxyacid dehydrogenase family protein n=1 Tax=Streptomyces sp. CC224B TaxID=3044571 RepID=UPI0024A95900|nr:D-isomer specific 2-hydroxyacid dehydrogenase family protein [Streptomyces sp. CC224B]
MFRELAPRFGVVPTLTKAAVSEATIDLAVGNRCISVGHKAHVTRATLLALSRAGVKYLSTRSVGCDHIDVRFANSVGISVGNVTYSPDSVADYTLMLMLMAVRHAKATIRRVDAHDYRLSERRGKELRDLTVGVVGTGRIGTAVIDRLRGFGCRVLAYDNRPKASVGHTPTAPVGHTPTAAVGHAPTASVEYVPIDALFRHSDVVTLHIPLTAETRHLVDRRRIEQMTHGAFIVNTGRGPLIDTEALLPALESGRLGGAALDVLDGEEGIFYTDCRNKPIENRSLLRLHELPNVVISPHVAYYTDHALSDTVRNSLINCLDFESGKTWTATG